MAQFLTKHVLFQNTLEISSRQTLWSTFRRTRLKMWPQEHTQDFCKIWPCDLVLEITWPKYELYWDIVLVIVGPNIQKCWTEMWPHEHIQDFSKIWPSGLVLKLKWSIFKILQDIFKANILTNFLEYWTDNVASRAYKGFSKIWPSFFIQHASFSNFSKIQSRQTSWLSFMSIQLKMWRPERTQGLKF